MKWKRLDKIKGTDGYIPIKGKDYYTKIEIEGIKKNIKDDLGIFIDTKYKNATTKAISITPRLIRDKLEELEGDSRLDASAIKNIGKYASTTVYRTSSSTWGSITGTLSEQTDLVDYIDTKIATNDTSDNINAIVYAIALG
jgi:hypothetical protein